MSRPKKKASEKKVHVVATKLSDPEYKMFLNKLNRAKMEASEFLREVLEYSKISLPERVNLMGLLDDTPTSAVVRLLLLQSTVQAKFSKEEIDIIRHLARELQTINENYAEMRRRTSQSDDIRSCFLYLRNINELISEVLTK